MRIDKFLSNLKYATRSQVKSFLKEHLVKNGETVLKNGSQNVDLNKDVYIDDVKIFYKDNIYLMMNKPKGYVSATTDRMFPCVVELLKHPYDRFDFNIAGRLDIDTTGLLLLSTDGMFIHEITHPKKHVDKTYIATLDSKCVNFDQLLKGVIIKDDKNQPYLAKAMDVLVDDYIVNITIDEGKFHQVKRMFEAIGNKVIELKRIRIGNLILNDLEEGNYVEIRKEDIYD